VEALFTLRKVLSVRNSNRWLKQDVLEISVTMTKKVAVVTGSNKGIGFATVKGLLGKFDGDVFLTSRNEELGLAAIE